MTYAPFRTSHKKYTSRPPAKDGPVVWMRLLDGYWGAERPDGSIDEIENTFVQDR